MSGIVTKRRMTLFAVFTLLFVGLAAFASGLTEGRSVLVNAVLILAAAALATFLVEAVAGRRR